MMFMFIHAFFYNSPPGVFCSFLGRGCDSVGLSCTFEIPLGISSRRIR